HVALDLGRSAEALAAEIVCKPAGTGIHRGDQDERRGEGQRHLCSRDRDLPVFKGLSQHLENVARKFRQFIEKQNAVVRHAYFAGPWDGSASNQTRIGDRVMRRSKWASGVKTRF